MGYDDNDIFDINRKTEIEIETIIADSAQNLYQNSKSKPLSLGIL